MTSPGSDDPLETTLTARGCAILYWILGLLIPVAFLVGLRLGASHRLLGDALAAASVKRHAHDVDNDAA